MCQCRLTHVLILDPVPKILKVVQLVMAMTMVHFLSAPTGLLRFRPRPLNQFTPCASTAFCIVEGVPVLAVIFVASNVKFGNEDINGLYKFVEIGKLFGHTLYEVN